MAKLFSEPSVIGDSDKCDSVTVKNKVSKTDNNNLSYLTRFCKSTYLLSFENLLLEIIKHILKKIDGCIKSKKD